MADLSYCEYLASKIEHSIGLGAWKQLMVWEQIAYILSELGELNPAADADDQSETEEIP